MKSFVLAATILWSCGNPTKFTTNLRPNQFKLNVDGRAPEAKDIVAEKSASTETPKADSSDSSAANKILDDKKIQDVMSSGKQDSADDVAKMLPKTAIEPSESKTDMVQSDIKIAIEDLPKMSSSEENKTVMTDDSAHKKMAEDVITVKPDNKIEPDSDDSDSDLQCLKEDGTTLSMLADSQYMLWPPNHKEVTFNIDVKDNLREICKVEKIVSNEVDDKLEDDFKIEQALNFWLRAERNGQGTGRIYSVTISCDKEDGKESVKIDVVVPHDKSEMCNKNKKAKKNI